MGWPPIELLPIPVRGMPAGLLEDLQERLRRIAGSRVRIAEPLPPERAWLEPARGQYSSRRVVDALLLRSGSPDLPPPLWTLAITDADLFAGDREFVFGEATLGGAWAVVSIARLQSHPGDVSAADLQRITKEALHELGHLAGLEHCARPLCVMSPSPTPADVDLKECRLCPDCSALASLSFPS